jgi:hypothetical protein
MSLVLLSCTVFLLGAKKSLVRLNRIVRFICLPSNCLSASQRGSKYLSVLKKVYSNRIMLGKLYMFSTKVYCMLQLFCEGNISLRSIRSITRLLLMSKCLEARSLRLCTVTALTAKKSNIVLPQRKMLFYAFAI